ncbi:ROK family protein [Raineyella fluvialis]|nr:ROK family protein [Raineyella fluvialis]
MKPTVRGSTLSAVLRSAVLGPQLRSRADIAQDTGLTKPTVSKLVEQLMAAGVLADGEAVSRGTGRPSTPLVLPPQGVVGIGVEIASDHLGVRAVDLRGATVDERRSLVPTLEEEPGATVDRTVALLLDVLSGVSGRAVSGVCVSVPGRLSVDRTTVLSAPNLSWTDVPLLSLLAGHPSLARHPALHAAPVTPLSVHNDSQLAAEFELSHRGDASFMYVFGETGIGGAIVIDGELYVGTNGWAGEIGHVAVEVGGARCRCGRRGCLEAHASYDALRSRADLGPDVPIHEVVDTLARRLGDRRAVIEMIGVPLGYALANTLNVLDLSTVVLGGYFAPIAGELEPVLHQVFRERALAEEHGQVRVGRAVDDAHPALSGATRTALDPVLNHTPEWIAAMAHDAGATLRP